MSNIFSKIKLTNQISNYTPSVLNYYEEYTFTTTFMFGSGGSTGTSVSVKLVRIGSMVTMNIIPLNNNSFQITFNQTTNIYSENSIPNRFCPNSLITQYFKYTSSNTTGDVFWLGRMYINLSDKKIYLEQSDKNVFSWSPYPVIITIYGFSSSWCI